jgi:predicted GIY-YIG superfamily endonuclease
VRDEDLIYYIYRLVNVLNNKSYIGQTISLLERMRQHNRKPPLKMRKIMVGVDSIFKLFTLHILFLSKEKVQANRVETYFVSHFQSRKAEFGYNTLRGCPYADPKYWAMRKHYFMVKGKQ